MRAPVIIEDSFRYDPSTGNMWRLWRNVSKLVGNDTGNGCLQIRINNTNTYVHRLAFFLVEGRWPEEDVDHKNGDASDNRWRNIREATTSENLMNTKLYKSNTSGVKGVGWYKSRNRWIARIQTNMKTKHLGYFLRKEDAERAVINARTAAHGEFCNHGTHKEAA